jgi:predicted ATPase
MLKAITLKDFKSYKNARLPLAPLTVLIGANASGKSNAIEGMRLMAWLAQGRKLSAIQYSVQSGDHVVRGRVAELAYHHGNSFGLGCETTHTKWNHLDMTLTRRDNELHVSGETLTQPGANVPLYTLDQPSVGSNTDVGVAYNNFAKGGNKPRITCNDQSAIFTQLTSPATFGNSQTSKENIPAVAKQYERWLSSILFLDPVPARMREYSFPSEKRLQGDGTNLSGVLFNLLGIGNQTTANAIASSDRRITDENIIATQRKDILSFIQSLPEQDISGLDFLKEPRGGVMVQLIETFGGESQLYDASLLSDGTLRVLAIAAAMLSAEEGSLVVIEEIDNGVHPSRARHLLAQIRAIAERRQLRVLLSTHNPALLDALPDVSIPDVVFCYRDPKDGSSRLVRLEEVSDYPELIAQGTLGHLVTTGALESFVKNRPLGEERKTRALKWLETMRAGDEQ